VLERAPGSPLEHNSTTGTVRVHSADLNDTPAVVVASEPMDENPAWRPLASGELLHVDHELQVSSTIALKHPPDHPLTLADLTPHAAQSQTPQPTNRQ
jgi:glutamine amidotransferase